MSVGLPSWGNWKRRYNSPPHDIIRDFYAPAFERSIRYDRAVGFFSSRLLAEIAPWIDVFVLNGGHMRILTSPANLSEEDLLAIGEGEELKERLRQDVQTALDQDIPEEFLRMRLKLLTWMVAHGRLEIRIALRKNADGYALFHEKIGVFADAEERWMTFNGSPNETLSAMKRHAESFPLFCSWASDDQRAYASADRERFEDLWNGDVEGVKLWAANEWILDPLRAAYGERAPSPDSCTWDAMLEDSVAEPDSGSSYGVEKSSLLPRIPEELTLRQYQKDAVNDWLEAGGRGIFAMATGTGKTLTALSAATQVSLGVARQSRNLFVLIVVPLIDLVYQWKSAAQRFGFRPAVCHGNMSRAEVDSLKATLSAGRVRAGQRCEMVITTAATLSGSGTGSFLATQLERIQARLLVIGDEVHSLGTSGRLASLPRNAHYTLGLSATPKRHGDDVGTERILEYFGDTVVAISIKDAIYKLGALVEYDYHVIRVNLTAEETKQYRLISSRIAAAMAAGDDERCEIEIRKRVRLVQHAEGKLFALRQLISNGMAVKSHIIVYVAEGKNPDTDARQFEQMHQILTKEFGMRAAAYVGETGPQDRHELLSRFQAGEIQALLAMKCLDEGVDIPSARIGIITASSQNPRQFVQRRGRLLRKDPMSPKPSAALFDFLVLPAFESGLSDSEKRLIGIELSRAAELADSSRNREVLFEIVELAFEVGLDPRAFTWMNLERDEEMENWQR